MGDEIRGHQGAVAVTGTTDALGVGNAESHAFVDSGLGVGDKLIHVVIVGFLWDRRR